MRSAVGHRPATGLPWDASYRGGAAPWDTGRPQPAVERVAWEGGFSGAVLDVGGTGDNALYLASLGLAVLGVDVAETALAIVLAKAVDRGIAVELRRLTNSGWSVSSARSRPCSTARCSIRSTATSGFDPDEIPLRRRTRLARDDQADLERCAGR